MDQLYCIYRSIEKSICSTISASFPSACIVSFLAFISYMVLRLFFSLHKNRSKNFSGVSGMVYQGVWTAIFIFYTYMVLFRTWIARKRWEDPLDKIFGGWAYIPKKETLPQRRLKMWCFFSRLRFFWGYFWENGGKSIRRDQLSGIWHSAVSSCLWPLKQCSCYWNAEHSSFQIFSIIRQVEY